MIDVWYDAFGLGNPPAALCDISTLTNPLAVPPLFTITTDRVRCSWSGPPAPDDPTASSGRLSVRPLRHGCVAHIEVEGQPVSLDAPLHLAEQTAYRVFAASRNGEPVEVRHRDPLAVRDLAAGDEGRVVAGTVDFGGQVGRSVFELSVGGVAEAEFAVDVFPTKLSAADVEAMRADLDDTLAGLAFAYLRATSTDFDVGFDAPPNRAVWLTLLGRGLDDLERALHRIAAHPHRDLIRGVEVRRAEQVRRPDAALRAAVRQGRGAGAWHRLALGLDVRSRLPERQARPTLDTAEHRWLRARLDRFRRTVAGLRAEERVLPRTARRARTLDEIGAAEQRLVRLLRLDPLAAASHGPPPPPTPRLLTAPGYAEAYAACRAVDASLAVVAGPSPHAQRDLWALYELWCTLTLVRTVADRLGVPIPPGTFFRAEHRGVRLRLRRGHRHTIDLANDDCRVRIAYNPRFAARPGLLAQRPDLLLTVWRGGRRRQYVLDAKYRRDDAPGVQRRYGAPAPPESALGDLHRYRDAIVNAAGERTIAEAVALYPHRADAAFGESRVWTAIGDVGVGAIPLVPGATEWLGRWAARVLQDERRVLPS